MTSQLWDPLVIGHDVVFSLVILAFVESHLISMVNDLCEVVSLESSQNSKKEGSFRVVSGTLVLVWQVLAD